MAKMTALVATSAKARPELMKVDIPQVKDNEVLVEVNSASINPVDHLYQMMDQNMKIKANYPFILGNDFSGIVTVVGKNVSNYQVGDQVYGRINDNDSGTFAEYLAIDSHYLALAPKNISLADASGIPLVGLTAYQALFDKLDIQAGQKVFINAGSGGVGTMAIQLAKARGAFVATTISERNRQLVTDLGADQVLDYHEADFSKELSDFDAVFDTHGGDDTLKAIEILKRGGKIVTISGMPEARFAKENNLGNLRALLFKFASNKVTSAAKRKDVDYRFMLMKSDGEQLAKLTKLVEDGQLQTIVDRTFSLSEISGALDYAAQGHAVGKVIINIKK